MIKTSCALFIAVILLIGVTFSANAQSNLLTNGDFELEDFSPTIQGWYSDNSAAQFTKTNKKVKHGKFALEIKLDSPGDAPLIQSVKVKPNSFYKFSGWIASQNVTLDKVGAILSIMSTYYYTPPLCGTLDWTYYELIFKTHTQTEILIAARLGMWGNDVTGTAYFDDLKLEELKEKPGRYYELFEQDSNYNFFGLLLPKIKIFQLLKWLIFATILIILINLLISLRTSITHREEGQSLVSIINNIFKLNNEAARIESIQKKLTTFKFFNFKINLQYILLILILVLGIWVRVYHFGDIPPGMNQDAVSGGYDSFALANYGIDGEGHSYPMHFLSCGAGQSALYAYVIMPFIKFFGLSETTERIGLVLFSILTMFLLFLAVKKIVNFEVALLTTFIFAIAPWSIMSSRWGLPENILPSIFMIATYFYILSIKKPAYLLLSFAFFALCLYAYGTAYFVVPLFLIVLTICSFYWTSNKAENRNYLIFASIIFALLSIPIIIFLYINIFSNYPSSIKLGFLTIPKLSNPGDRYFAQVLVLDQNINGLQYMFTKFKEYYHYYYDTVFKQVGAYWNVVNFGAYQFGNVYLISNFFFIVGFLSALFEMVKALPRKLDLKVIFIFWFIISSILAMISETNPNRANIIYIPMIFFIAYGVYQFVHCIAVVFSKFIINWPKKRAQIYTMTRILAVVLIIIVYLNLFNFFTNFYFHCFPNMIKEEFRESFDQAIDYTVKANPGKMPVYISNFSMANFYVLFYTRYNPHDYVKTVVYRDPNASVRRVVSFGNYYFIDIENGMVPQPDAFYIVENKYLPYLQYLPNDFKRFDQFSVLKF